DLPHGRRQRIIDQDQVIVRIERQLVRVKWAFRLARRAQQLCRKSARHSEPCGREGQSLEEVAAIGGINSGVRNQDRRLHGLKYDSRVRGFPAIYFWALSSVGRLWAFEHALCSRRPSPSPLASPLGRGRSIFRA